MKTEFKENKGLTFTTTIIVTDTKQKLEDAINKYFQEYLPAGYFTEIVKKEWKEEQNIYKAEIRRYTSCD